jgi:8-oxo-dGTP diphosphatase
MAVNTDLNYHSIVMCTNIIARKDDTFLFLKRSPLKKIAPNILHPVGGKIDNDEDPYTAAQRELFEETGLTIDNIKLEAIVTEVHPPDGIKYNCTWLVFYFSGDYTSGTLTPNEEGEFLWVTKEELDKNNMFPSVGVIIDDLLNPHVGTLFARFLYDKESNIISKQINHCKA